MIEKLEALRERYEALSQKLADPEVIADPGQMQRLAKAHSELEEVVTAYMQYRGVEEDLVTAREMLAETRDAGEESMLREEIKQLENKKESLQQQLRILLLPKDPNDDKNVILEIRAGTGGEEAALFAADLFRMYSRYSESRGWKMEILSTNPTELGGFKEIIVSIEGAGAYSALKFESGVHRVQRVPETEAGGRIHTSAASVIVLPEAEEVDVTIDPNDIRIDVYRSSGHGGQSVNTTDSAVRVTHLPTGIVVACQDEKSQLKNKEKALKILRARLLDKAIAEQQSELSQTRRDLVRSGDRSERIRTYNFPQNRVTDHRIGLTLHKLDTVIAGDLQEIIDALILDEQTKLLQRAEA
ncbi:MAG TPA: peptide chain release factor 1 [Firmicutes bacterium]|jgi:peptide chain release factor 1|nr:peptide chain release factor 1 [Bacillota bacterium]HOQ23097.1 peptide chain release factor 1 [Bacillota bacterium]HPT66994.1 peptide chain release factor 1 [Bacillota bacterium]